MKTILIAEVAGEERAERAFSAASKSLAGLKPEASYFFEHEGRRSAFIVFDLADIAQAESVVDELLAAGCSVELHPVTDSAHAMARLHEHISTRHHPRVE